MTVSEARAAGRVPALGQEFIDVLRGLRRAPGFTLLASTTLALGLSFTVAANAYLGVLVRPSIEAPRAEQLRFVFDVGPDDPRGSLSSADLQELQASRAFARVAGWRMFSSSIETGDATLHAWGHGVSGEYFALFGAGPALGRLIGPDDDRPGAEPVVVLGHRFWERRLASDPAILGRGVRIEGRDYTVVGVTADGFQGEGIATGLYLPLATARDWLPGGEATDAPNLSVLGRMPDGSGAGEAPLKLAAVARTLDHAHPRETPRRFAAVELAEALAWSPDDSLVRGAQLLAVAASALLLLACGNVASLMLARGTARRREWAVRAALGASRARLARATLLESLVLAAVGASAALPIASALVEVVEGYLLRTTPVEMGAWGDGSRLAVDRPAALALCLALAAGAALVSWLASFTTQRREDLVPALKADGEGGGASGPLRLGGRRLLVASQAALSTVLLVMALLAARSLGHLGGQPLGFETRERAIAGFHVPPRRGPQPPADLAQRLLDEVRALPGVRAAGFVSRGPLSPALQRAELEAPATGLRRAATYNQISDGYLSTLGIRLDAGRDLRRDDTRGDQQGVVVSRALAEALWPGAAAVGQRLRLHRPGRSASELEVVGVASDSRQSSLAGAIAPHVFLPLGQWSGRPTLVVHATSSIAEPLRRLLRERHADVALIDLQPLVEQRRRSLMDSRMSAELAAGLAALSLLLAAVGLFGLLSYGVARRSREFGIRLALGARRADLLSHVMTDAVRLVGVGIAVGLLGAVPVARFAASRLVGVTADDPVSYAASAALLLIAGLAAAYGPARRAARCEPLVALRRS